MATKTAVRSAEEIVESIELNQFEQRDIHACIRDGYTDDAIKMLARCARIPKAEATLAVGYMAEVLRGQPVEFVEIEAKDVRVYSLDEYLDGSHGKDGPVVYLVRVGRDVFQSSAIQVKDRREPEFQHRNEFHYLSRADQIWEIRPRTP